LSVNSFKDRVDKHWAGQVIVFNWHIELSGTTSEISFVLI